ncbi:MAG: GAF domain-containing protein [Phycisphaeraceae bacterium]
MPADFYTLAKDDAALADALSDAVRAVGAEEGSILLLTPSGQALRFAVCSSSMATKLIDTQQPVTRGVVGLVASFQQPTVANKLAGDPQHDPSVDEKVGTTTRSQMAVPLSDAEHEFGVVTAINSNNPDGFTNDDLQRYLAAAKTITARLAELSGGLARA